MPGLVMVTLALSEMLTHDWDLARATGQQLSVDDVDIDAVLATMKQTLKPESRQTRLRTRNARVRRGTTHRPSRRLPRSPAVAQQPLTRAGGAGCVGLRRLELRQQLADVCQVCFGCTWWTTWGHPACVSRAPKQVLIKRRYSLAIRPLGMIQPDDMVDLAGKHLAHPPPSESKTRVALLRNTIWRELQHFRQHAPVVLTC